MATHPSVLAWRIPGMRKPGGLPSMGSHRVGHDWSDLAYLAIVNHQNPRHPTLNPQKAESQVQTYSPALSLFRTCLCHPRCVCYPPRHVNEWYTSSFQSPLMVVADTCLTIIRTTRASQATTLAPKGDFLWGMLITSMSPGKQSPRQSQQKPHCLQPKTYRQRKSKKEQLAP